MSFFKDFKEDFSQAMNELLPGEDELKEEAAKMQPELVVNTLEQEVDAKSEMKKMEGLFEKVGKEPAEEPMILTPEEPAKFEKKVEEPAVKPVKPVKKVKTESVVQKEQKESVIEPETFEKKEDTVLSTENTENTVTMETTSTLPEDVSDEVTVITEGTSLKGDLQSTGSFELKGKIEGNVTCNGKMTVTGSIKGNSQSAEFFADSAKVEGEISTTGTVKIGLGSVVIGNISATSAVIAGAIKGDIDVHGPVVVDTSAVVMGNIKSRSVQINNGAVIEGFCSQCYADVDVESLFEGN